MYAVFWRIDDITVHRARQQSSYIAPWWAAGAVLAVPIVTETTEGEVVEVEICSIMKGQGGEKYP
jgi:hypothetical protein